MQVPVCAELIGNISDKVLLGLIRKYLQSGIMVDGVISQRIEGKLKLIVNKEKSKISEVNQTKFLGYTLQKGGILTIAGKSLHVLKLSNVNV